MVDTTSTKWSKLNITNTEQPTSCASIHDALRTQLQWYSYKKCITWIWLWGNIRQMRDILLLKNVLVVFKKVQVKQYKERLRECFGLKETKETWQINAFRILEWILDKEKKRKFTVSFIKILLGQLNGEYVLWVR